MKPKTPEAIAPPHGCLFTARQAAQYLGVSVSKVRQLLRRGELIAVRTDGGRLQGIYEHDCDAWQAQHRTAARPVNAKRVAVDEAIQKLMPRTRVFS